jgi:hypothetical protein
MRHILQVTIWLLLLGGVVLGMVAGLRMFHATG